MSKRYPKGGPDARFPNADRMIGRLAPVTYFQATGEFRPPKADEWYISGALPEAHQAPSELPCAYFIAVQAEQPQRVIFQGGYKYQLVRAREH